MSLRETPELVGQEPLKTILSFVVRRSFAHVVLHGEEDKTREKHRPEKQAQVTYGPMIHIYE